MAMTDEYDFEDIGCGDCCCGFHGGPDCPWVKHGFEKDDERPGYCFSCGFPKDEPCHDVQEKTVG